MQANAANSYSRHSHLIRVIRIMIKVPIEVSARHIHLSKEDKEILFGKGYELKKAKQLYQPRDFLAEEKLIIEKGERRILNVAIVGPERTKTQVELSHTDLIFLKLEPVVRDSGDIKGSPGATLIGPAGKVNLKEGVINTWRHIHLNPKEAKNLGLKNGQMVSVKTAGECSITFHNVKIKVGDNYRLCLHLDTDEGNAAGITKKGEGEIII